MSSTMFAISGWTVTVLFAALAVFQLLLALGLPLGRFAWGGFHERPPRAFRIASALAVGVFVFGILAVLERAGLHDTLLDARVAEITCWILTAIFALSTLGNLNSRSPAEKRVMTPVAVVLTISCLLLALGAP